MPNDDRSFDPHDFDLFVLVCVLLFFIFAFVYGVILELIGLYAWVLERLQGVLG